MIKKEMKLTKAQIEPFKELKYFKTSIAEMMVLSIAKEQKLWETLEKECNIREEAKNLRIDNKKQTLIYYIEK